MKAIHIDAKTGAIKEVETNGKFEQYYPLLGCDMLQTAMHLPNGDCIYVDEEGLYNGHRKGFTVSGGHQPFFGGGLVVGSGKNGDDADCKSTVEDIREITRIINIA